MAILKMMTSMVIMTMMMGAKIRADVDDDDDEEEEEHNAEDDD